MKRILLLLSLLLAPSAFADDLITSWGYSTSTKQVQAQTRANGWVPVQTMLKQYVVGTAYTNGTPAISSAQAGWTVTRAVLIPYQTSDGAWRLRFNIAGTFTSTSTATVTVTISGTSFKSVAGFNQAISALWFGNSGQAISQGYCNTGTGTVNLTSPASITVNGLGASGDVEIDSKPTWAD